MSIERLKHINETFDGTDMDQIITIVNLLPWIIERLENLSWTLGKVIRERDKLKSDFNTLKMFYDDLKK